jgi:hypothetical protein
MGSEIARRKGGSGGQVVEGRDSSAWEEAEKRCSKTEVCGCSSELSAQRRVAETEGRVGLIINAVE